MSCPTKKVAVVEKWQLLEVRLYPANSGYFFAV